MRSSGTKLLFAGVAVAALLAACGSDGTSEPAGTTGGNQTTVPGAADTTTPGTGSTPAGGGEAITLAVNPWTGSAVNAYVAQAVIQANLGSTVNITEIDENATWVGMDDGSIDAVLEVWPSGHAADKKTYIDEKKSVVDLGLLGPKAKIGWYVPKFVIDEHPELATWEGFKDPKLTKLFATAESGDLGQFTMGDPSYVTFDEQIIANLKLPLKYVVAGSEAALLTLIDQSFADKKPILIQFWQPHWKQSQVDLVEVKLPDVTQECLDSAANADGAYACDYAVDDLFKAASAKLETKNSAAFNVLKKLQLTTDQQNEIAAMIDGEKMAPADAAKKWVDANPDVWKAWLS
jgi:glycine betaine/proline transport system substrate-binding protein